MTLHDDDVSALLARRREAAGQFSPGDQLLIRDLTRGVGLFLVLTKKGYRRIWSAIALTAGALAWLRYAGGPWVFWD